MRYHQNNSVLVIFIIIICIFCSVLVISCVIYLVCSERNSDELLKKSPQICLHQHKELSSSYKHGCFKDRM